MCMCVCVCVNMYVYSPHFSLKQNLSLNLELADCTGLADQLIWVPGVLLSPSTGVIGMHHHH